MQLPCIDFEVLSTSTFGSCTIFACTFVYLTWQYKCKGHLIIFDPPPWDIMSWHCISDWFLYLQKSDQLSPEMCLDLATAWDWIFQESPSRKSMKKWNIPWIFQLQRRKRGSNIEKKNRKSSGNLDLAPQIHDFFLENCHLAYYTTLICALVFLFHDCWREGACIFVGCPYRHFTGTGIWVKPWVCRGFSQVCYWSIRTTRYPLEMDQLWGFNFEFPQNISVRISNSDPTALCQDPALWPNIISNLNQLQNHWCDWMIESFGYLLVRSWAHLKVLDQNSSDHHLNISEPVERLTRWLDSTRWLPVVAIAQSLSVAWRVSATSMGRTGPSTRSNKNKAPW